MTKSKKRLGIIIAAVLLMICIVMVGNKVYASEIKPILNNGTYAEVTGSVSSSGYLTVTKIWSGKPNITSQVNITTYVERKVLGVFWSRIDIGLASTQWTHTVYDGGQYTHNNYVSLPSTGTYRITSSFVFYGSGGSPDTVNRTYEIVY